MNTDGDKISGNEVVSSGEIGSDAEGRERDAAVSVSPVSKGKNLTDAELQKKSIKSVVQHLKKKIEPDAAGIDRVCDWIQDMDEILAKDDYNRGEYIEMRKQLNDAIEWVFDVELRHKLRNSWYSFGKAMDKKAPKH